MMFYNLTDGVEFVESIQDKADFEVQGFSTDSRTINNGDIFIAIKGEKFDGHEHIQSALDKGAVAVICEQNTGLYNCYVVRNSRKAYGQMCYNFYGRACDRLKLIGVTGTNGKTTITTIVGQILEKLGKKVGVLGTIENKIDTLIIPAKHTTPDPFELHALFEKMLSVGCEYAIMEVSSHALDQNRLQGCRFEIGAFTNFTQDHLDYHLTMENYFKAKCKIFDIADIAIINRDDDWIKKIEFDKGKNYIEYSNCDCEADLFATDIKYLINGVALNLNYKDKSGNILTREVKFGMPGTFSVSNLLCAVGICLNLGFDLNSIVKTIDNIEGVRGRTEVLYSDDKFTVIRDYAHSSDSLEKLLSSMRSFAKGRLIVVFGCAGKRDRGKRKVMADVVSKLSDIFIITSDNPRDEDEMQIINDALLGVVGNNYVVEKDRYKAIEIALKMAQKDDLIILAGKGHEDYQVLDFGTIYFDEKEVVKEIIG